jgi:hypothetical protein
MLYFVKAPGRVPDQVTGHTPVRHSGFMSESKRQIYIWIPGQARNDVPSLDSGTPKQVRGRLCLKQTGFKRLTGFALP